MNCPNCKKPIPDEMISKEAAAIAGRSGKGKSKRRNIDYAKLAAKRKTFGGGRPKLTPAKGEKK